jgi:hypothetical protein
VPSDLADSVISEQGWACKGCGTVKERAMNPTETEYLLTRAQDEAVAAIQAEHPAAAAAHQRLSLLYSAKAILELGDEEDDRGTGNRPSSVAAARPEHASRR